MTNAVRSDPANYRGIYAYLTNPACHKTLVYRPKTDYFRIARQH
jgi:hypothetical protein